MVTAMKGGVSPRMGPSPFLPNGNSDSHSLRVASCCCGVGLSFFGCAGWDLRRHVTPAEHVLPLPIPIVPERVQITRLQHAFDDTARPPPQGTRPLL